MSVEAHKCNVKGCKGFIVFENEGFDYSNPPIVKGEYEFHNPKCTECDKEYKVVPCHVVVGIDEDGDTEKVDSASIKEWKKREKEREFENEKSPYEKVKKFIELRGYTYSVEDVIQGFQDSSNSYVSHTMKDCILHLNQELKSLVEK